MPSVPYVTSSPWWSSANLNTLVGEFDRRLTRALAGKTPYLLGYYGVGDSGVAMALRKFTLPIATTTFAAVVDGTLAGDGVMGAVHVFTGEAADVVYFERTTPFDQGAVDAAAAGCSEVSRDSTARTMVVDDTSLDRSLDWSLTALTREDDGVTYWLAPQSIGGRRAMRRHQYAVAELALEGLEEFTVPRGWDRYQCFRLHNLSPVEVTVTVETTDADGEPGEDETITLPKFGCRSFRRTRGYYNADLNYFWRARARQDRRFYDARGGGVPEASAAANPIARINVIASWLDRLGAQRDPWVDPPNETARYGDLFGDPGDSETKIHDLVVHRGAVKSVGWDEDDAPVETDGTIGHSPTLEADLAAVGIALTDDGNTYTLDRAEDAPGEEDQGLDLFCPGTNLLWVPAGDVEIPGVAPFAQPLRRRQYHTLPVTLVEDIPIDSIAAPHWTGYSSAGSGLGSVTRTLYGDTSTYASPALRYGGSSYAGDGYTVKRLSEIGDAGDDIDGPHSTVGEWRLTPFGFAAPWDYSYTFVSGIPSGEASEFEPLNGGIYQRWDGVTVERRAWAHITAPGWSLGSWKPLKPRTYGLQEHDAGGPGTWIGEDWERILSDPDGGEPAPTGKVLLDYPDLKYLDDGTPDTNGDVFDRDGFSVPVNVPETRYQVPVDPDESRSVVEDLSYARRGQFNKGQPTLGSGDNPPVYYLRRRMQVEDYNGLAWMVNGWTKSKPLISIKNVWLKRTNNTTYPGIFIPDLDWPFAEFPTDAAFHFVPGEMATEWTKANVAEFLTVYNREDMPNWVEANEAHKWKIDPNATGHRHWVNKTWDGIAVEGDEYFTVTVSSLSESRESGFTGSQWDYSPDGDDFGWCRISDVVSLAGEYGLPFVDVAWGAGRRLMVRHPIGFGGEELPHPLDGEEFNRTNGKLLFLQTDPPPSLADSTASDIFSAPLPVGLAEYVPANDIGEAEYIRGRKYDVDGNGTPINPGSEQVAYNRGTPTITGNSVSLGFPPVVASDPYYPADDALAMSRHRESVVVRVTISGYDGAEANTLLLLGSAYSRQLSSCDISGTRTGGSWFFTSGMAAQDCAAGLTIVAPGAVEERPARLISDPYIDLAAG